MSTDTFNIPIIEDDTVPMGDVFLLPRVHPVLHVPPEGFASPEDRWTAEWQAILEAYTQAARRGEVAVLRGVKS